MRSVCWFASVAIGLACLCGCLMPPQESERDTVRIVEQQDAKEPKQHKVVSGKKRSAAQVKTLREFAMKESPKIWQTIQSMQAEIEADDKKIKQLRADLLEFGRDPDSDDDYKAIVKAHAELRSAYNSIFDKLEDAYIAAKKYEASPNHKDYQDTMKRAIEDGLQEANFASERYKTMSKQK